MTDLKILRNLIIILICLLLKIPSFAAGNTVVMKSLSNFSSMNPVYNLKAVVVNEHKFKSGFVLEKGTIIAFKVEKITEPRRGKRNVYIVAHPTIFYIPSKKQTRKFQNIHLMSRVKQHKKLNKKQAAQKGAVSVTGVIIPGFSQLFYFCKGFINPEDKNSRLASGGISVYENSPLSYIEKGDELYIKQGDYLKVKFFDETNPKWKVFNSL